MKSFNEVIGQLDDEQGRSALKGMQRGIEREALRIEASGHLATDKHPKSLGSALTHSRITTDYSESLLEFITPVHENIDTLLTDLTQTHAFTVRNIGEQRLWPVSMPCYVGDVADIPIADYGESNVGQLKRLYRKGLTYRYGAQMQIISGVHFNFSVSEQLWDRLYQQSDKSLSRCDFISESYFGLIRNYRRLVWVLPYLFGASPALCGSFIKDQQTDLAFEKLGKGTLYLPYATSLRMSDLGYTNKEQERLHISYNSLGEYLEGIKAAIEMPSAHFEAIGVKVDGEYRQLNANVLQIENEFYSPIRAKRVGVSGEKPSEALARAGVEYIEVRALDVNPFSPVGIDADQVRFLDLFLLHCLLNPSPNTSEADEQEISHNLNTVIIEGRKPGLMLQQHGEPQLMATWLNNLFAELNSLATMLDGDENGQYKQAIAQWQAAVDDPAKTFSGRILNQLLESQIDHSYWVKDLAQTYYQQLMDYPLSTQQEQAYQQAAASSLAAQAQLESNEKVSFEDYLVDYFAPKLDLVEQVG
ncbi:glutamate--cysteine ligase [Shewanella colwelliana]|uniref:Glutamate--cysteine ligase n=1 Tax=Shewanella colwelliana TaxID=23 RepID=A0A1E5IX77_SHECO|nr:glutamate--cysteine ligase [Shewanella colwelliana]OEG75202.1 glutamate--cysteine ligase [Shewanella colwelliana]